MRILATNPDTIGDLVLRQPLYAALQAAGHELMLVVRPLVQPLVPLVAPGAAIAVCKASIYNPALREDDSSLSEVVAAARAWEPDVLLVAPYQWTVLEERLAADLPHARLITMSGKRFGDPRYGTAPPSGFPEHEVVQVAEEVAEVRKNELLAGAVLGTAAKLGDPAITASEEQILAAEGHLNRMGVEPGGYWIACVGNDQYTAVRNWRPERWSALLAWWARTYGRRFVLVGHEPEREVSEQVRAGMGDRADAAALWAGNGDGDLDVLLGLIAGSAGYIGRDTGPMHLAAAMQKPILAIFGGGTWPRFVPNANASVVLTVGVPCAGCNWQCHLPESVCVKDVPMEEAQRAVEQLEAGEVQRRLVRTLPPSVPQLSAIGRQGAAAAMEHLTQLSVARRELMEQTESMAQALERSARQAGRADVLEQQLEALRAESNRRESILKQRLAAAENLFRTREAEMQRRLDELEKLASRVRSVDAEWSGKMNAVQERSRHVHEQFLKMQREAADLRLQLERSNADQQTLLSLTRQQEQQLGILNERVHGLVVSRWRKYGQRLRLCMTMPWEQHYQNGWHK
jgi:ADP-heptose:LPS heptosyltransferase